MDVNNSEDTVEKKFKPRPPRNKPEMFGYYLGSRKHSLRVAQELHRKGYSTRLEGPTPYYLWYWKKPDSKRAEHAEAEGTVV